MRNFFKKFDFTSYLLGLINLLLVSVASILGLRFLFRLFSANPDHGFVEWIYSASDTMLEPFRGIFSPVEIAEGSVFEFSVLFAIVVYGVFAALLISVIEMIQEKKRLNKLNRHK